MKTPSSNMITYVTSNETKFKEAQLILEPELSHETGFSLIRHELLLDEIQGTAHEIVSRKVKAAFHSMNKKAVIVDDVSFHINALHGLPGPYIKTFLQALGEEGIWSLVSKYGNHSCTAVCMIGFMRDEEEGPHIFHGEIEGDVVPPRGTTRHGKVSWNCIMQPHGMAKTMGELSLQEISSISPRFQALRKLKQFLLNEASH